MADANVEDRVIRLGPGLPAIPERLLLAHARGEVLFITGAGISRPANLPDFRGLVMETYEELDGAVHDVISKLSSDACTRCALNLEGLSPQQSAEVQRFRAGDFDVALGMLERRMDGPARETSQVRRAVVRRLTKPEVRHAPIHTALMKLADRGGAVTMVTTNFDLLLEEAARNVTPRIQAYALGGIPRPARGQSFAGVMHIHGVVERDENRISDLIVSDQDFGEFYLRRRTVPDFIYDAARLFNLVLVGYSANDPPMRYLLNAVAADGTRFDDLKERFTFVGSEEVDPIAVEDWKGRGITPVPYDKRDGHVALLNALERWAELSPINGKRSKIDAEIKRIVKVSRSASSDSDRDLFDHLLRRSSAPERIRLTKLAGLGKADFGWLDAIASITREPVRERRA